MASHIAWMWEIGCAYIEYTLFKWYEVIWEKTQEQYHVWTISYHLERAVTYDISDGAQPEIRRACTSPWRSPAKTLGLKNGWMWRLGVGVDWVLAIFSTESAHCQFLKTLPVARLQWTISTGSQVLRSGLNGTGIAG